MEQENKSFIHDTINLDEIRMLLGEDVDISAAADEPLLQETEPAEAPEIPTADPIDEFELSDAEEAEDIDLPTFLSDEAADAVASEDAPAAEDEVEKNGESLSESEAASAEEQVAVEQADIGGVDEKPEKKKNSAAFELYNMLHDVIYLLAAVTLIFVFVVRLVGVQGDSMLPTLHNRDYLLLESNFLYGGEDLTYGDVVVLKVPSYEMQDEGPIVKRVIATEGQEVNIDFETGAVYVDGVLLHETYINTPTNYNWDGEYGLEYPAIVPEDCIFVLGDNRNNSLDSRYAPIGMVDERCVLGKVLLIVLPGQTVDNAGNVIDPRDWGRIGLVS